MTESLVVLMGTEVAGTVERLDNKGRQILDPAVTASLWLSGTRG